MSQNISDKNIDVDNSNKHGDIYQAMLEARNSKDVKQKSSVDRPTNNVDEIKRERRKSRPEGLDTVRKTLNLSREVAEAANTVAKKKRMTLSYYLETLLSEQPDVKEEIKPSRNITIS